MTTSAILTLHIPGVSFLLFCNHRRAVLVGGDGPAPCGLPAALRGSPGRSPAWWVLLEPFSESPPPPILFMSLFLCRKQKVVGKWEMMPGEDWEPFCGGPISACTPMMGSPGVPSGMGSVFSVWSRQSARKGESAVCPTYTCGLSATPPVLLLG